MKSKKIVFLGTPEFAATVLETLINNDYNVVAVVSQPDKMVGRKRVLTPTPVKEMALKHNIEVFQPVKLKEDYQFLIDIKPDLLITCAYGQILTQIVLDIATINNINVHASLLPKLRGGAPIQRSIINGDKFTGVTIMQMVKAMDAGVMYSSATHPISEDVNSDELFKELSFVGSKLLIDTLPSIIDKTNNGVPQDENMVTYAYNIKREEEKLNFNNTTLNVHNLIRGLAMSPATYALLDNKSFKIYRSKIHSIKDDNINVGTLIIDKNKLLVKCSDGYLEIIELQIEGKSKTLASNFINGIQKNKVLELK